MKVLISGGGIAGTALAFWLSKVGHQVTVVEWWPKLRTTGLQLDLRGHGIEVLKRMGLASAYQAKSIQEQGIEIVDGRGRRWAWFGANKTDKGRQSFTTDWEMMRGDICQLFHDAAGSTPKYIFGTSIDTFEQHNDKVNVRFANGQEEVFDLVVGADGQGSRTRKRMVGAGEDDGFRPLKDMYAAYFTVARPAKPGEVFKAVSYITTNGRYIMTRRHSKDAIQVYMMGKTPSEKLQNATRGNVMEEKAAIADVYHDAGWESDQLLKEMWESNDFYLERQGIVTLDSWHSKRVVLVGDAAWCPSANTGMGTTSSVVGAYILAGELASHEYTSDGIAAALEAYEDRFRPFMESVQKGLLEESFFGNWFPRSAGGVYMLNCLAAVVSMLKLNVFGEYILRENVGDWKLPLYPALGKDTK